MSSGYTEKIKEGISFNNFAMLCARAFGACVEMREDPLSAEIPQEFKPSTWHYDSLQKAKQKLQEVRKITLTQAAEKAETEYKQRVKELTKRTEEMVVLFDKYNDMLSKIDAWKPPTKDHIELKNFMRNQITDSMKFDCDVEYYRKEIKDLVKLSGLEWKKEQIQGCKQDIAYHTKNWKRDVTLAKGRTKWVKALRRSLKHER
jgi:hypothetical protein